MRKILADENRHDQRAKTSSHELTHRRQSTAMSDFLSCWGQTNVGVPPKGRPEDDYCSPGEMTSEGRETIRGRPFRLSPIDRITLPFPGGDKESALAASAVRARRHCRKSRRSRRATVGGWARDAPRPRGMGATRFAIEGEFKRMSASRRRSPKARETPALAPGAASRAIESVE